MIGKIENIHIYRYMKLEYMDDFCNLNFYKIYFTILLIKLFILKLVSYTILHDIFKTREIIYDDLFFTSFFYHDSKYYDNNN